ncbi:VanW family protein [Candidatus Poriferisodalis sp.]|uniref:VanW family protein n=1 Tax=Candidatus Poriferisodalis sp. TaxID=3101277 RepID=UPI003B01ADB1
MQWSSWAPKWSIISATAILVSAIAATAVLSVRDSADAPAPTAPATTDGPAPTQVPPVIPAPETGTPTEVSPDALQLRIARLAAELAATPVLVRTDVGELQLTIADLGITLESDATYNAVKERRSASTGSDAGSAAEPWSALSADPQFSERRFRVERPVARAVLAGATELGVTATPPSIIVVDNSLAVDLGRPGQVVDADAIVDQILEGIARAYARIEIAARLQQSQPLEITPELQQAVDEAHERYGRNLVVTYKDHSHELTLEAIAGWLTLDPNASPPMISFSTEGVGPYFEEVFSAQSAAVTTAAMTVVDGVPTVVASDGAQACCADEAGTLTAEALLSGVEGPIALPSRPAVSREEQTYLESLGIVELVGAFTTKHACCQSRVTNIQLFADLMRGVVVEGGQSLSLNGHVGKRTEEKGFVEGGFIEKGVVIDDIGGGVSQFATTIFNALIHAGMDIDEYQTHSLYLSRYPYGLDPTISYPKPDLRFTNPTPYGILIWPAYTDTSITVEIYSTRNVVVTIGEPEEETREFCRRVRTDRTRMFSDGTTDTDTFHARYRPEEGRNCDGTRSVPRRCIDPLLAPDETAEEGAAGEEQARTGLSEATEDADDGVVEDGSERADGSIVECPPLECVEKPGERDSELPRYPDDPCLDVDLEALAQDDESGESPGFEGDGPDGNGTGDASDPGGSTPEGGTPDDTDDSQDEPSGDEVGADETTEPARS